MHSFGQIVEEFGVTPSSPESRGKERPTTRMSYKVRNKVDEPRDADFEKICTECSFIGHCVEDAETLSEPEWYAAGTIFARCEDGEEKFHEVSKPHPGYREYETQGKLERALEDTGPYTCEYIANSFGEEYCSSCKHYGRITSPIQLGSATTPATLEEEFEKYNIKFAVAMHGNRNSILWERKDHKGRVTRSFLKREDFFAMNASHKMKVPDGRGGSKVVEIAKEWFRWKGRRQFEGVVFEPGKKLPPTYYNLYRGFGVESEEGDWSLFFKHILEVIADQNEEICTYILNWIARIVQDPGGKRPGTSLVLRAGQGTGKGMAAEYIGRLFNDHFVRITNGDQLTGKFNSHLETALIVFVDEGTWGGDKQAEGILKALITEPQIMIEPKGKDSYMASNYANIIIASNNDWIVPAGVDERRFLVLDVSEKYQQDHEYFAALVEQMENGGLEAMLYDLLKRDLSGVNLRSIPRTSALLDQVLRTLNFCGKYWYERLDQGYMETLDKLLDRKQQDWISEDPEWNSWAPSDYIYQDYLAFCAEMKVQRPVSSTSFFKELIKYCPALGAERKKRTLGDGKRTWGYELPSLEECRKAFSKALGVPIDWPVDQEERD